MLMNLFKEYREDQHAELVIIIFKILANIAGSGKENAEKLIEAGKKFGFFV